VLHEEVPTKAELKAAYRIAGKSFAGILRKMFIILADDHVPEPHTPPAKAPKASVSKDAKAIKQKKRRASDEGSSTATKKIPATQ